MTVRQACEQVAARHPGHADPRSRLKQLERDYRREIRRGRRATSILFFMEREMARLDAWENYPGGGV